MIEIPYKSWLLRCDPDATRAAYALIEQGAPERCGCNHCLNFIAQRERVYPPEVLTLTERLGVNHGREAEVYHLARGPGGLHQYGGWFHFIGSFEGPDAWETDASGMRRLRMTPVGSHFSLAFRRDAQLLQKPFEGRPVVQLEFLVNVPWILDSPEPD